MLDLSLDDQRLLAWHVFGEEWIRALRLTGKRGRMRRKHLREQAIRKVIRDDLKRRGANCGNCSDYRKGVCLAHSDFYGDAIVKPYDLCTDWTCKKTT